MTEQYLKPNEEIRVDGNHRWLLFAAPPRLPTPKIESALSRCGLHWWNIRETARKVPGHGVGYMVAVEATVPGVTPVLVATKLGTKRLLVVAEPVSLEIEKLADIAEGVSGQDTVPVRFGAPEEHLNPGQYYATLVYYYENPLDFATIQARLQKIGMDALNPDFFGIFSEAGNRFLYLITKEKNPTIGELQSLLEADMLNVNMFPADKDSLEFGRDWSSGFELMKSRIKEFSLSMQNLASSLLALGTGAADVTAGTMRFAPYLIGAAAIFGVGLIGYYGFAKARNKGRKWSEA